MKLTVHKRFTKARRISPLDYGYRPLTIDRIAAEYSRIKKIMNAK